ncbi:DEAD/DEAH box helicase, partial [Planctomycetota bacterium]|nr:DEAD/DEAH box helicase [Planctomycetota bacterium]
MSFSDSILGPEGLIARKLKGYEDRPQQLKMANAVEEALTKDQHLVVEAGTGVGKSFAYLVPAIKKAIELEQSDRPIVISTGTIALQEQLYTKDIPFLRSIWEEEFTAVLAKGRGNYVSLRRLERAAGKGGGAALNDETRELLRIQKWAEDSADGSLSSMSFQPAREVWQQVVSDSNNCLGRQCPNFESKCFYQRAKRRNAQATILIVNHALLCADLSLKGAGVNYLPDYRYLIIDEAHDFERYASDHLGIRVTEMGFNWTLSQVLNSRKNKGIIQKFKITGAMDLLREAKDYGERFFLSVEDWAHQQRQRPARVYEPDAFENKASEALRALAIRLKEAVVSATNEEDKLEIEASVKRVHEYADSIDSFVKQSLDGQVYWVDTQTGAREQNTELRAAPVHVGHLMDQLMFDRCKSVIMTSATLATGPDDFKYISNRLGVPDEKTTTLQVGSPFDYKAHAEIVIPDLPEPPKGGGIDDTYEAAMAD